MYTAIKVNTRTSNIRFKCSFPFSHPGDSYLICNTENTPLLFFIKPLSLHCDLISKF